MATFGKRSNQRSSGSAGEIFIKNFKEPRTLVWFLEDDPDTWVEYKQHFDNVVNRGWPCAIYEGGNNCVGCEFPIEDPDDENDRGLRVRRTASRWVFPVIDEKGYVSLYQIGYKLWAALKELYSEYGTLTDAQYAIRRSGDSWNKIEYTPTRTANTDQPKAKVSVPDAEYISSLLGRQYTDAMDRYEYDPDAAPEAAGPDPEPVTPATPGDTASEALAGRKSAAAKKGVKPDEAQATHQSGTVPNPTDMGLGELKDWLDNHDPKIDYPPRAGRPVLVGLVQQAMAEDKPPF